MDEFGSQLIQTENLTDGSWYSMGCDGRETEEPRFLDLSIISVILTVKSSKSCQHGSRGLGSNTFGAAEGKMALKHFCQ